MNLSMTTDYVAYLGDPGPYLRRIAETGFTHVHWCHEWNTDYLYSDEEVAQAKALLRELDLDLLDLHASNGVGRSWGSLLEEERSVGVKLIRNRIDMTARLSGRAIVLHLPPKPHSPVELDRFWASVCRSLDELEPHALRASVRIALENMEDDRFDGIERLFSRYGRQFLGLCYDSGHGNIGGRGLDHLERFSDRLVSIHLHDNDGRIDHHNLPFTGTVDWPRLARLIADSSYDGCMSLESNMRGQDIEERLYLRQAYEAGSAVARLIETERQRLCSHAT
jgi:sugar phosphate isomerase/epimerase